MKVGVSIPDEIFAETEYLAKRLKTSRSELYSRALGEFLKRHAPDRVTEATVEVIAVVGETTDALTGARRARFCGKLSGIRNRPGIWWEDSRRVHRVRSWDNFGTVRS